MLILVKIFNLSKKNIIKKNLHKCRKNAEKNLEKLRRIFKGKKVERQDQDLNWRPLAY